MLVFRQTSESVNKHLEPTPEQILIQRILAGEQEVFASIVEDYKNMVFALFMRSLGNRETAEDLTQEVFVKAFRFLKSFRSEAKFSTWLTRIALNTLRSHMRSKQFKRDRLSDAYDSTLHEQSSEHPDKEHSMRERLRLMQRALADLSDKDREVLLLCAMEGRTYGEAAEILELPLGTVRSRLSHARTRVRKLMQDLEGEGS